MKMLSTYSSHIKFENDLLQYRVRGKIKNRISTFSFDRHNKIFILKTLDLLGGDIRVKLKKGTFCDISCHGKRYPKIQPE